ncbi:helix-turn-helix domain-containing protein [Salmonella enterica]|nr:helix-turn-helix domain-containing protein [Salmonella enterica]EJX0554406.1 helix-turn-helix domain-containing protein [Salmonella enterica]EJX0602341.1 helix-turn-helix domain-containing protein [Salmonella enterica]
MDIQSAICECDIAHAILIAMWSYKKTPSPNESILQSLTFAVESSLDRAKNVFSHKKNDAIQPYFTPYRADLPAPTGYTPNNLGNRIQIARENLGLSEVDLAEKLDIHPGYVLTWEDGTDQPLAGMIIPLANALRCDPMWLLTGKSHHEPVAHTVMPSSPVEVMQNVDVSTIGKRIGVARVANHMNTQELEEAIGAPDGTVFRWETGKAIPSSQYIDSLAKALDISVTWLLTGREMETSHA